MPHVNILNDGWVSRRQPGPTAVAAGPRLALTDQGELVCSFVVQRALAVNDFKPVIARSADGGKTWSEPQLAWPHLAERFSIFCSVSRSADGRLWLFGSRTPIDVPGESFWNDATQGMKQNELIWSESRDGGRSWTEPQVIPMPIAGTAEAAGAMCVTRDGRWLACYSPYNTFDKDVRVDRAQVALVSSRDGGRSWSYRPMLRFREERSSAAEAWVIELSDGRLLGTSWHLNQADGSDFPIAYAVSATGGETWSPTRSAGIAGQATSLAALPEGDALMVHTRRKNDRPGVWLCRARPTADEFGEEWSDILWAAPKPTQSGTTAGHSEWADFAFGEPAIACTRSGEWVLVFWCIQAIGSGIRFVRFRLT